MPDTIDKRLSRIEEAIDKLTDISKNLEKITAVYDQRLLKTEKDTTFLFNTLDKRREELDQRMKEIKCLVDKHDSLLTEDINNIRKDIKDQFENINNKVANLEKFYWSLIGAMMIISWVVPYILKALKIL